MTSRPSTRHRFRIGLAGAASLLLLAAGLATLATAATADEPQEIQIVAPDPALPVELSATAPRRWQLRIEGTGTPSTTTVTLAGEGVRPVPAHAEVDSTSTAYVSIELTAEPGLHTLTMGLERAGHRSVTTQYTVWVAGGRHLGGADSLAGQRWAAPRAAYYSDGRYNRQQQAVWFVDSTHAVLGWPSAGLSTCGEGCVPYWYDASSGLVQLGEVAIGVVQPGGIHLDGVLPAGDDWEDGAAWFDQPLGFWAPQRRVAGRWTWRDGDELPSGAESFTLRLRRDGSFALREGGQRRVGRYVIRRAGLVRLRSGRDWSRRITLARCLDEDGTPRPGRCLAVSWPGLDAGGGVLDAAFSDTRRHVGPATR